MTLGFNVLLTSVGISPENVRLVRHQEGGSIIYRMWRDRRTEFEYYQSQQARDARAYFASPFWASFVVDPSGNTLFAGLYQVEGVGIPDTFVLCPRRGVMRSPEDTDVYQLLEDDRLSMYAGKLIVDWGKGTRSWRQRAELRDKPIVEIRRDETEELFPGFTNVIGKLSEVESFPKGWRDRLSSVKGVYLLTCSRLREQYVGSATGESGFWGRWSEYVANGHGGNIRLLNREPSDYQVSILEVAGSMASRDDILAMEERWKRKLQSREMGLNAN